MTNSRSLFVWFLVWSLILIAFAIFQSGFYNPDSFKYVTIAHGMMSSHDYLLPMWQGHPYSDKGPLMFWFFILGWKLTGLNHWWPQLLMGLTATASIFMTLKVAEALWPEDANIKKIIPFVLLGLPSWLVIANEIRVDIFLVFLSLLGIFALVKAYQGHKKYWYLLGVALIFGFICKGPVILLYTALPALFMPFIFNGEKTLKSWYSFLILTILIAMGCALLWAVPAAIDGGSAFTHQILFKQVYHRAFEASSLLYYVIRIPLFIMPWVLYAPFLIGGLKLSKFQEGEKLCWLVIFLSFLIFSFYGQKRVHYIDPDFPLLAIIIAKAISNYIQVQSVPKLVHQWFMGALFIIFAATILVLPHVSIHWNPALHTQFLYLMKYNIWISMVLIALACFYFFYKPSSYTQQLFLIMLPTAIVTSALLILRVTA